MGCAVLKYSLEKALYYWIDVHLWAVIPPRYNRDNSALHFSGVGKLSTSFNWLLVKAGT